MGRFSEAIADYNFALTKNPNLASSLFGRGIAELRSGNSVVGEADLAAAEASTPGLAERFKKFGLAR